MKCTICGTENPGSAGRCRNCGKPLFAPPPTRGAAATASDRFRNVALRRDAPATLTDHTEVGRRMRFNYAHGYKDAIVKELETLQVILEHFERRPVDSDALMKDAVNLICKQFGIANATIGLRDPDGMYRYKIMVGLRPEIQEAQSKLSYTEKQFGEESDYKGTKISKFTKVYLEEDIVPDRPDSELYNRPGLLGGRRLNAESCLEGDYIDYHILGVNSALLGWIETGGTRTGKMPDTTTIRLIELMASMIGVVLSTPEMTKPKG